MAVRRNGYVKYTVLGGIMLFFFVISSIPGFLPDFYGSYPVVLVPFVACVGLFEKEIAGGFYGLFAGMLLDAYSAFGGVYSTLMLCACGFAAGLLGKHLLTENILSSITLTAGSALAYYIGFWLVFYVIRGAESVFEALVLLLMPGFLYTVIFVLLFYPLIRSVCLKARKEQR